jgi:pyridoxal phosphate enzyme (YggS family)
VGGRCREPGGPSHSHAWTSLGDAEAGLTIDASIATRWWTVRDTVVAACSRVKRDPADITIIAVSRNQPANAVEEAISAGVTDLGEASATEFIEKLESIKASPRWHFIGRPRREEIKLVVGRASVIHAVSTARIAEEIERRAATAGVVQPVLVEVNVVGEDTRLGVSPGNAPLLIASLAGLAHVRCDGLMTIPPQGDLEAARRTFAVVRELRDRLATRARPLSILSMGTSADYEAAILEGATHLRIGTAIFGEQSADPTVP